jgi:hypothetical protein
VALSKAARLPALLVVSPIVSPTKSAMAVISAGESSAMYAVTAEAKR